MTKKYLFSTLAALALGFVVSCDNTTDDPPNQDKTTSGGVTITGPRILSKINNGTKDIEEYITTGGALSQAFMRDAASTNTLTATVTYSGSKVTAIKYQDNVNPHVVDNLYALTYTSGKLSGITMDQTILGTNNHSDFTVLYDANGELYRIVEKKKLGGSTSYTHYVEAKYTFSASNVVKTEYTTMLMSGGNPDPSTASTISYTYENYDSKVNPYTTLPKEYFIVSSTLAQINAYMISSNNVGKITIQNPLGPPISVPKGYLYDSQNYPTSDQAQIIKYIYKPL
ncbi:hypothetical protein QFZ37_000298 [Chryseobacterium ginsenosidimutans]|uniref:hypothetical protein n=1 Tax=Chryseobacterium ginsenosidimutans TaxID=687846 RepID=UPI00277D730F|nr:hypothetical protein [Chryseobacterium ginsenosidimutans]MDQ0591929.1 hypothetical protein [Chryseobacterium ginsenosidimutans]